MRRVPQTKGRPDAWAWKREYGEMEQCSANQTKGFLRKKVTKEIMIKMSLG